MQADKVQNLPGVLTWGWWLWPAQLTHCPSYQSQGETARQMTAEKEAMARPHHNGYMSALRSLQCMMQCSPFYAHQYVLQLAKCNVLVYVFHKHALWRTRHDVYVPEDVDNLLAP